MSEIVRPSVAPVASIFGTKREKRMANTVIGAIALGMFVAFVAAVAAIVFMK